jgi:hypothetical protein
LLAASALGMATGNPARAAEAAFPLRVHESAEHLVDAKNVPFFYNADTCWMLFLKLTEAEAGEYLAARKVQGFNVVQVQLTGFYGMANRAGDRPFGNDDLTKPNEKFFAHVDRVIAKAKDLNLLLAIAPAWSGCCGEGWTGDDKEKNPKPLRRAGEKARAHGEYLGGRYGKFDHLMWILGGDNDPGSDRDRAAIRSLGLGLKATAPAQLVTFHAASSHSSTDVWPPGESWLDVSMTYTYFRGFNKAWNKDQPDVYEVNYAELKKRPRRPFFLGESTYEGEHGDWGSALQARKQAYWSVLSGAFGNAYGSPNWNVPDNWRDVLKLPGAASLKHYRALFESRPWTELVPDVDNIVAVAGRGEYAKNDYATTAMTADRSCAITYLPSKRALTIDLDRLAGERCRGWWFNPRDGAATEIGTFESKGRKSFEPAGEGDWVLVFDDAAAGLGRPGVRN